MAFLVPRGGRKRAVPAMTIDTVRGGRKGDPKHKCCGKKLESVMGYPKGRCVVIIAFQKTRQ